MYFDNKPYHMECWVRKKWGEKGLVVVDKDGWNQLWAYLRHVANVTDASSPEKWLADHYDADWDYTPGGDCW